MPKYPAIALSTRHYDRKPLALLNDAVAALRKHNADAADIEALESYDLTTDFDALVEHVSAYVCVISNSNA